MTRRRADATSDLFGDDGPRAGGAYSAKDIEVLEGLEPVRRRPGMYVGGTDEQALHHPMGWSPYQGRVVQGRVCATYVRGTRVFFKDRILAEPGVGRFVRPGHQTIT